jgi:hypothetical protein
VVAPWILRIAPVVALACWGANMHRQLGDGTWDRRNVPTPVKGISDAKDLAVTEYGTCVARSNGSVVCWGAPWGPEPTVQGGVVMTGIVMKAWIGLCFPMISRGREPRRDVIKSPASIGSRPD